MKFVCLGYGDEKRWDSMSESQREDMIEECLAYDEILQTEGHWTGSGEALQGGRAARTLRRQGDKTIVTDGPYAETRELLGGFGVLEARDLNHAIELMSKHPGVKAGPFEIRPAADLSGMIRESETRRAQRKRA